MSEHPQYADDATWIEIPGYDTQSRAGHCSVNGTARKGDRVFRGPQIDFEGFFDVSELALEQGARLIGFISPTEFNSIQSQATVLESENEALRKEVVSAREQIRSLTIQNAELYTQLEDAATTFEHHVALEEVSVDPAVLVDLADSPDDRAQLPQEGENEDEGEDDPMDVDYDALDALDDFEMMESASLEDIEEAILAGEEPEPYKAPDLIG